MANPESCSRCGQEVKYGRRGTTLGWLHEVDGDHMPILGQEYTAEMRAEVERQLHIPRTYDDGTAYTTAEHDIRKDKEVARRNRRLAELEGRDPDYVPPIPPVEIPCYPVEPTSFPARSGIRTMCNRVSGSGKTRIPEWELKRLTMSRGPYIGTEGTVLSISDVVVLGAVDSNARFAVGSWRDGAFDFGFIGEARTVTARVNSTQLTDWIKGKT